MTGERTEAEWEYELVSEYGKLVVLYVGLLSVLYKSLHGARAKRKRSPWSPRGPGSWPRSMDCWNTLCGMDEDRSKFA